MGPKPTIIFMNADLNQRNRKDWASDISLGCVQIFSANTAKICLKKDIFILTYYNIANIPTCFELTVDLCIQMLLKFFVLKYLSDVICIHFDILS